MKKHKNLLIILLLVSVFTACSSRIPTHKQRLETAKNIVGSSIKKTEYKSSYFNHLVYLSLPSKCKKEVSNIYIEGDGLAWITPSKISNDPTPINPMALKMFKEDDSKCKIYIARPCQYIASQKCSKKYWTSHRFSQKVIQSYTKVMNTIKKEHKLHSFNLIGYSGGGAIATILAAKRNDIKTLVTVAGNLDIDFWTKKHHILALHGSLNPANFTEELEKIKQYHFIGEKDKIIDKSVFASYVKNFKNKQNVQYEIIKCFTHNCCWNKTWRQLINKVIK